jgi:hypothetical protein
MIAGECGQEQARELVADRLAEAEHGRRRAVLDLVQTSAMLEDESEATAGLRRGGVHDLHIGRAASPGHPSPE